MNLRCRFGWHSYETIKEINPQWLYDVIVRGKGDSYVCNDPRWKLSFEHWARRRVCLKCGHIDDEIAALQAQYEEERAKKEQAKELFDAMSPQV